jgi:integrase
MPKGEKGMNIVEPIRDRKKLELMKAVLKEKSLRDWCLFVLGINSGLRVGDIVRLKVSDVYDGRNVKDRIELREQKTGKLKNFPLSESVKKALREYLASAELEQDDILFPSRKGGGSLSRSQVWLILHRAAKKAGIRERIGTHSMRKTFGYQAYKNGTDFYIIQDMLNLSSPAVTRRYIGLSRDDTDRVYKTLNL